MVRLSSGLVVWTGDNKQWFFEALDSLLSQNHPIDELLITLNGKEVFVLEKEIKDVVSRSEFGVELKILHNESNEGLASALNSQLKECSGEYYMRMDSDDIARPNRVEVFHQYQQSGQDVAVFGSFSEEFTETGTRKTRRYPLGHKNIKKGIAVANPLSHPTTFLKVKSVLNLGGYDNSYVRCQDLELWTRILKNEMLIENIPEVLLDFRRVHTVGKRKNTSEWEYKAYKNAIHELGFPKYMMVYPILRRMVRKVDKLSELGYKYFKRK